MKIQFRKNISSIRELIQMQFRNRILLVFAVLIVVVGLSTSIEVFYALDQFKSKLQTQANELAERVMGEALVENFQAIDAIIKNENKKNDKWSVEWIADKKEVPNKLSLEFPFGVRLQYQVKSIGENQFGYFIFRSHFFLQPEIVRMLVGKLFIVLASCIIIGVMIYPLAIKVPKELIAKPVDQILSMVRSEALGTSALGKLPYRELQEIRDELKIIFNEKGKLEYERIEHEKAETVSRTAQMLAHDMKKPFNLLRMMTNGIKNIKDAEAAKNFIQESSENLESAMERLNQMMTELTHIGSKRNLKQEEIDLQSIVKESIDEAFAATGKNQIEVNIDLSHNGKIVADKLGLSRVISNLVMNAFQATSESGKIWVKSNSIQNNGSKIQIIVGNSGSYISRSEQEKVFQIFYTSGKKDGTGLGLSIVQNILRAHGGTITVTSSKETGTEFVFELPISSIQSAEFNKASSAESLRVLVIDDEEKYLRQVDEVVRKIQPDAEINFCKCSSDAIGLANEILPHVVICDIQLGDNDADGFDISQELRETGLKPYIYVHTSGMLDENRLQRKNLCGVNDLARKPLTNEVFENIVNQVRA